MVRKSKNVNITSPNVVVNPAAAAVVSTRTLRNRRRRARRKLRSAAPVVGRGDMDPVTQSMSALELQSLDAGRMTNDETSDLAFIRSITARCDMDENTEGWYFKYLDPAGSVETGRAIGEFSKIPDGLLTFSVDAEIRIIDTLPVPRIEDESGPGELPITGQTWSLTILSYPMFRTAYIAIANRFDKELSPVLMSELAFTLNNLTDYRKTIDSNVWSPFAVALEAGWYYWIKPLPPTYNLSDPLTGDQRTLTSWRMSYKSLTVEHNAPTLIDQGFWVGGHYALDPSIVQQAVPDTEMIPTTVHMRATTDFAVDTNLRAQVRIPTMPQLMAISGPATLNLASTSLDFNITGNIATTGSSVTFTIPPNTAMYNPFEIVFAEPGDVVSLTAIGGPGFINVVFNSSNATAVPFTVQFITPVNENAEAQTRIFVDNSLYGASTTTSNQIEFLAYNPSQISANNPKMEQFLMHETGGAYAVHKKMRKPVFELTPAGSFGPVQFTTPGYDTSRNSGDGSGIMDTFDSNFSSCSLAFRGIAHANVVVVKLYQGWEGVTNVNTPFGQFGHTGLPRCDEVMQLVDNITVRTTGIYPANDNFLGLIAKFAAGALRSLLSSQATPTVLGNLAQGAINKGIGYLRNKVLIKRQKARPQASR